MVGRHRNLVCIVAETQIIAHNKIADTTMTMWRLIKYSVFTLQAVVATYTFYKLGTYKDAKKKVKTGSSSRKRRMRRRLTIFKAMEVQKENPFEYEGAELTVTQRLVLSVGAVTLLPMRIALFLTSLVSSYTVSAIAIFGISTKDLIETPLPPWRRCFLQYTLRPCLRLALFSAGFLYIEEEGLENIHHPSRAGIVVSNHLSFLEPIYFIYKFMATPIAAIDHLHAPLVGTIVKAIQTVTVDRKDPKSKKNVIESMKNRAKPDTGWPQTLIFPEGTTTNGRLLITFKSGAFIPGVPVQPCVISYPREAGIFGFMLPVNPVSYPPFLHWLIFFHI